MAADTLEPPSKLPRIRRLRVCLLGGDTVVSSIGKTDVASAFLRGLTADQPSVSDPALDLAYEHGAFEAAWSMLLVEPAGGAVCLDKWGCGPLTAWDSEGRVAFDSRTRGELTPPYEAEPSEESASLCIGCSGGRMSIGHKRSTGAARAFREVLMTAGHEADGFEKIQQELYAEAEAKPRELVRRDRPCHGVLAAFARFSPEVGNFAGCGAVILHVFDPESRPRGNSHNVAMVYTPAPHGQIHKKLTVGTFLSALRAAGSNIVRTVREYNRSAAVQSPGVTEGWERAAWLRADLQAQVECFLSDKNMRTDRVLRDKVAADSEGWLNLEFVKGSHQEAELLDALSMSKCVETKVADDGRVFVRRASFPAL